MKPVVPVIRSYTYRRPRKTGVSAWVLLAGVGAVAVLGATTVFAEPNERITPKLPPVQAEAPAVERAAETSQPAAQDKNKVIVLELKGLVLLSDPAQLQPSVEASEPITLQNLPLLDDPQLVNQLKSFIGKPLSFAAMEAIRSVITDWCKAHDRVLMDVIFPQQNVTNGVLQAIVTESRLGQVKVEGNQWVSTSMIRDAIAAQPGERLSQSQLDDDLYFLNQSPFWRANAVLDKGTAPDTTDLTIKIADRNPLRVYAGYDNSGSPATGRARWNLGGNYGDVFGLGQIASYQFTSSSDFWVEDGKFMNRSADAQFAAHSLTYTIPLPWHDSVTVTGAYSHSHPSIDSNFNQIGQGGQAGIRYEHKDRPIALKDIGSFEQAVSIGYDYQTTNNNLEFGGTTVTDTMADLHQFSIGYKANLKDDYGQTILNNTFVYSPGKLTGNNNDDALAATGVTYAKAHYFYDRIDLSRQTPLPQDFLWNSRARVQFSTANLIQGEQLGSNPYDGIRGYLDQPSGSQGFILTQELYLPPFSPTKLAGLAQRDNFQPFVFWELAQFADVKRQPDNLASRQLQSLGLGFRYAFDNAFTASLDYGHQLQAQQGRTKGDFALLSAMVSF